MQLKRPAQPFGWLRCLKWRDWPRRIAEVLDDEQLFQGADFAAAITDSFRPLARQPRLRHRVEGFSRLIE
jgi:hypothetical protein